MSEDIVIMVCSFGGERAYLLVASSISRDKEDGYTLDLQYS
jgi:hypothetical protein